MLTSREPGYASWRHFQNQHASCGAKRIWICAFCVDGVPTYEWETFLQERRLMDLLPNLCVIALSLSTANCRMASWGPMPALLSSPTWKRRVCVPLVGAQCLPSLSFHTLVQYFLATRKGWVNGVPGVFIPVGEIGLLYLKSLVLRAILAGKSPLMPRAL